MLVENREVNLLKFAKEKAGRTEHRSMTPYRRKVEESKREYRRREIKQTDDRES